MFEKDLHLSLEKAEGTLCKVSKGFTKPRGKQNDLKMNIIQVWREEKNLNKTTSGKKKAATEGISHWDEEAEIKMMWRTAADDI